MIRQLNEVNSFTYLGSIISKDGGSSEDLKSQIAMAQGVFHSWKKVGKYVDNSKNQD